MVGLHLSEGGGGSSAFAVLHDTRQEGLGVGWDRFIGECDHVVKGDPLGIKEAMDLFCARITGFVGAIFKDIADVSEGVFLGDEFVDAAEGRGIFGRGEFGSNAEDIDGGVGCEKFGDLVFVEVVACDDACVGLPCFVKDHADLFRELGEITAIQPDPA